MNILCVTVAMAMINTLGVAMFDLNSTPDWANRTLIGPIALGLGQSHSDWANRTRIGPIALGLVSEIHERGRGGGEA